MYKIGILFQDREFEHDIYELIRAFYPGSEICSFYEEEEAGCDLYFRIEKQGDSCVIRYEDHENKGVTSAEFIEGQSSDALISCVDADDSEAKETLRGLSVLKTFDTEFIQDLIEDCRQNRTLRLSYRTPQAKDDSQKEVCAHRIVFQNDKIYLYGFDLIRKKSVVLNIKRIGAILARFSGSSKVEIEYTTVKFFLKNFGVTGIEENEVILENRDDGYIIEGRYYNDFLAAQRILSFGANCTVLEPQEFREKIIQKLINMRNVYNE